MQGYCALRIAGRERLTSFAMEYKTGCPRQASRKEDRHIVGNARVQPTASSATIQSQDAFSDKSRFFLSSGDNRVRVWRPPGESLNPAFALQRHTTPPAGVMIWGVIAYNTWSPLILIRGTMTVQRYVHDTLQPYVFPLMQRLPEAVIEQDNARFHTARLSLSLHCYRTVTTLPWPDRSPDLSPIEHIWKQTGRRVGHSTRLNEL
ncbi:transposable element Tcb2 transposase [Trichonephila clavipes]|nr:transposable element Tcb2 transposase [Trichonephila clavipes]